MTNSHTGTTHLSFQEIMKLEDRFRTQFVNSLSGYKGANLVGTSDGHVENLAIISSVVHIGANPPYLGMIMRPHTVPRHTLENIKQTGQYTINAVTADWFEKAHQTSARFPKEMSEFDAVGLTPWFSADLAAPYVAESPLKIGLQVEEITTLKCNNTVLVVGKIDEVFVNSQAVMEDGHISLSAMDVMCINGLDSYHQPPPGSRFSYAKPDAAPRKIA